MPFEGTADAIIHMKIQEAYDDGEENGRIVAMTEDAIEYTKAIMRKLNISLEKAMDILDLNDELKSKCLEYFKNNN